MRRLDQHSAESQTELEVAHERGELFPGAYVQVTLEIDPANGAVTIPAGTLLFRSGKPAVGVVHQNGTVEIRKIAINRDLGSKLVISQGLSESDQIITSAPPWLGGWQRRERRKQQGAGDRVNDGSAQDPELTRICPSLSGAPDLRGV
jgi:multidrug efflux pump subunit AcrA (membrane-fusion protein)